MTTNTNSLPLTDWLKKSTTKLNSAGISTARLDCLVILEDVISKDRSWLLAHPDLELSKNVVSKLSKQVKRRANHEPLAYIRGKREFYGREFLVNRHTLEPRSETETMIDMTKQLSLPVKPRIADVGAGSGAIGITLALELKGASVDMYEISKPAIKVAQNNILKLKPPKCYIYNNTLLSKVKYSYDLVCANLPYVPDSHTVNKAAMQEPKIAIFGGIDGLKLYKELFEQLKDLKPRYVLTESLPFQHTSLAVIANNAGYRLSKTDDFVQQFVLVK